jgi:hypothetical protein
VPAESPFTNWLPLVAELLTELPLTATEVALAVLHETVVEPGAVALVGLAVMEPDTGGGAVTFTVMLAVPLAPAESCASTFHV